MILERLLEETDQEAYQELIRTSQAISPISKEERSLMFDSDYFPFSGRTEELQQLEKFCGASDKILWWAVTGPGGMGKSRLVYEFCKKKKEAGWRIERFEAHTSRGSQARSLDELARWTPTASRTVVVLDDVQAYMEVVRSWLSRMARTARSESLRMLLLERDGKDISSASWLGSNPCGDGLDDWCYNEEFLLLQPLSDELLMAIMDNYAAAAGKKLSAERLLGVLDRVDPELKRPLYAIAIADARCQGKDPVNWDRSKILDTLLEREMDFHFSRLQGIDIQKKKISKTLSTELEVLLANSCIQGFLPIRHIDMTEYPTLQKRIIAAEMDEEEFFDRLGVLRTVQLQSYAVDQNGNRLNDSMKEETEQIIVLSCPDLIKEHLVLKQVFEKHNLELLPDGWQNNPGQLLFLRKLWIDYPERLKDQADFWNRFFGAIPPTHFPAQIYAYLLWGCMEIFPDLANRAVDCLAKLHQVNDRDTEVASCYAKCLLNLSCDQPLEECTSTVDKLGNLYSVYQDCLDIAQSYARALLNLSTSQSLTECTSTVDKLENIYSAHKDYQGIPDCYAAGISVLSFRQEITQCAESVSKLKKMYSLHHNIPAVGVSYARAMAILASGYYEESTLTRPDEFITVVQELESLCYCSDIWEEFTDDYAAVLISLALCQSDPVSVTNTLDLSRKILQTHPNESYIQLSYAMTWFNLTLVQTPQEVPSTLSDIRDFLGAHSDIIPDFKTELDKYLNKHPDHAERYRILQEL